MPLQIDNLPEAIIATKKALKRALPNYAEVFTDVEGEMKRRVEAIVRDRDAGQPVVPTVDYADIVAGTVPSATVGIVKNRGACVIRNVFAREQVREWNDEIGRYVDGNGLTEKLMHAAEDKYFGTLAAAKPQIYGIY